MPFKRKLINRYKVTLSWEGVGRLTYENNSDNLSPREIAEELRKIAANVEEMCDRVDRKRAERAQEPQS
jgi:hypothetical protein